METGRTVAGFRDELEEQTLVALCGELVRGGGHCGGRARWGWCLARAPGPNRLQCAGLAGGPPMQRRPNLARLSRPARFSHVHVRPSSPSSARLTPPPDLPPQPRLAHRPLPAQGRARRPRPLPPRRTDARPSIPRRENRVLPPLCLSERAARPQSRLHRLPRSARHRHLGQQSPSCGANFQ